MAESLPASVEALTLQSTTNTSKFPACFPSLNAVDIYREHIAEELGKATGIDAEKIYARLAWSTVLDRGDLNLPVRELYPAAVRKTTFPLSVVLTVQLRIGPSADIVCFPYHLGRLAPDQKEPDRTLQRIGREVPCIRPRRTSHRNRSSIAVFLQGATAGKDRPWSRLD